MLFRQSPKILLSYRRADTRAMAGRLADHLKHRFGADNVFIDVDNIPYGTDFRDHIRETIERCDVVIALIGPAWSGSERTHRRIDEPEDHLRIEIETALRGGTTIIPVLIDEARMPASSDLPPSVAKLAFLNAAPLDSGRDFETHTRRIADAILDIAARNRGRPPSDSSGRTDTNTGRGRRNAGGTGSGTSVVDRLRNADPRRLALAGAALGAASGVVSGLPLPYPLPDGLLFALPDALAKFIVHVVFVYQPEKVAIRFWHPPYVFAAAALLLFHVMGMRITRRAIILVPVIALAWAAAYNTAFYVNTTAGKSLRMSYHTLDQKCVGASGSIFGSDDAPVLTPEERSSCDEIGRRNDQVSSANTVIDWIIATVSGCLSGFIGACGVVLGLMRVSERYRRRETILSMLLLGTLAGAFLNTKLFVFFDLPGWTPLYVVWQGCLMAAIAYPLRRTA